MIMKINSARCNSGKGREMAVHANYLDGHVRSMRVALSGKSDEAQQGAYTVIQGLLRLVRSLKEEDQTFDNVREVLEMLALELRQ
jgi:hypothetical protein